MPHRPWIFDTLSIALSLGVILCLALHRPGGEADSVKIQSREGTWRYPLSQERKITIPGPLGETVIQIKERKVSFISSPCQGQDCVRHAPLEGGGSFNACLPNEVLVTIESDGEVDDVTT